MSVLSDGSMAVSVLFASLFALLLLVPLNVELKETIPKVRNQRELKPEDWQPIHYQAYGTADHHFLAPEQTLEFLKQLKVIYAPFSERETNGRKSRVAKLVEASVLRSEKCTRSYLADLQTIQKYNSPFRFTIVPYIGHAIRMYLDFCESKLLHNLHDQVRDLKPQIHEDLLALVNATMEVKYGNYKVSGRSHLTRIWLHFGHLIEGLVEYLEHKFTMPKLLEMVRAKKDNGKNNDADDANDKTKEKKEGKRSRFKRIFQEHVMDVCAAWTRITDPIEAFHEVDLRLKYTNEESDWISYGHFCHFIERHRSMIFKKTWRQFQRRTSKFPKFSVGLHRQMRKFNPFDDFS